MWQRFLMNVGGKDTNLLKDVPETYRRECHYNQQWGWCKRGVAHYSRRNRGAEEFMMLLCQRVITSETPESRSSRRPKIQDRSNWCSKTPDTIRWGSEWYELGDWCQFISSIRNSDYCMSVKTRPRMEGQLQKRGHVAPENCTVAER